MRLYENDNNTVTQSFHPYKSLTQTISGNKTKLGKGKG